MTENKDSRVDRNFILQQGLELPGPGSCGVVATAHLVQPRVVLLFVLIGTIFQSAWVFLALSAVLWLGALMPRWNPVDAVYNMTLGAREGAPRIAPAPAPRRFSQGMAGTFALAAALLLFAGANTAALVVEVIFIVAALAVSLGRLCLGSFVYHLIAGRGKFAVQTLPWADRQ